MVGAVTFMTRITVRDYCALVCRGGLMFGRRDGTSEFKVSPGQRRRRIRLMSVAANPE
jgi:hypothetical protein